MMILDSIKNLSKNEENTSVIENEVTKEETSILNKLISSKLNGKDLEVKENEDTVNSVLVHRYTIPLKGKGPFHLVMEYEKQYSLKEENFKIARFSTFTREMNVLVNYPDDVSVSFFNIGNAVSFKEVHQGVKNQIYRRHEDDILMPYQGFGISFEKH